MILIEPDFYQILETSDVPAGVVNIITGESHELAGHLAKHDNVDGIWISGTKEECETVKKYSVGNLKIIWTNDGKKIDWFDKSQSEGREWIRRASQVKNVWIPYGE